MSSVCKSLRLATAVIATLTLLPASLAAQSQWLDEGPDQVSLEVIRPELDGADLTLGTMAVFPTFTWMIPNRNLEIVVEVPFSRADWDNEAFATSNAFGNPYVGVRYDRPGRAGLQLWGGGRLPLASSSADAAAGEIVGMFSSVDRMEAFLPDLATVQAGARYIVEVTPALLVSGRLGMNFNILTDPADAEDSTELYSVYGVQGWTLQGPARIGAGLTGRGILTESKANFANATLHEAGVWADYAIGRFRPGVHLRLPLDQDLRDVMDYVVGLSLQYRYR